MSAMRRTTLRHCGSCHEDAESGDGSTAPEDWCCSLIHAGRRPRILRADEPCEECESKNGAERHDAKQQAVYAIERYKPIIRNYELCGTCGTFLGINTLGGGIVVKGTEHEWEWWDYSEWYRAGFPRLHPSRSTRVPIRPTFTLAGPSWPPAVPETRDVPHEWRR